MKTRITICEYLNYVDEKGRCIGHGKKVYQEAVKLLDHDYHVTAIPLMDIVIV